MEKAEIFLTRSPRKDISKIFASSFREEGRGSEGFTWKEVPPVPHGDANATLSADGWSPAVSNEASVCAFLPRPLVLFVILRQMRCNFRDNHGHSLLMIAAQMGDKRHVAKLREHGGLDFILQAKKSWLHKMSRVCGVPRLSHCLSNARVKAGRRGFVEGFKSDDM